LLAWEFSSVRVNNNGISVELVRTRCRHECSQWIDWHVVDVSNHRRTPIRDERPAQLQLDGLEEIIGVV